MDGPWAIQLLPFVHEVKVEEEVADEADDAGDGGEEGVDEEKEEDVCHHVKWRHDVDESRAVRHETG